MPQKRLKKNMTKKILTIAIDGPVGSGKGTLGIALAKKLNALYVYTGGMYRALALACLRKGIDLENEQEVLDVLESCGLHLEISDEDTKVFLGSENVNDKIFLPKVSNATPIAAAHSKVREEMVRRQKEMIKDQSSIVEGRDATTKIVPDADIKIYLTADINVRAKRRYEQFLKRGINKSFEEVLEDTKERDRKDMEREASPLVIIPEAYVLDSTDDKIEDTVEKVIKILKDKGLI